MNTPIIYKFADKQPEFPCWVYSTYTIDGWWHCFSARIWAESHTAHDTHWCHSKTRPTVMPEAEPGSLDDIVHNPQQRMVREAEEIRAKRSTQPAPCPACDCVEKVAEEIADRLDEIYGDYFSRYTTPRLSDTRALVAAVLRRRDAEKDAEMKRRSDMARETCRQAWTDAHEANARAERAEAELAELKDKWQEATKSDAIVKMLLERDALRAEVIALKTENTTLRNAQKACEDCMTPTYAALNAEVERLNERMEWLHRGNDRDAEGYEWGVFRVKWDAHGQPESVLHTRSDLTDLDAAIGASRAAS